MIHREGWFIEKDGTKRRMVYREGWYMSRMVYREG